MIVVPDVGMLNAPWPSLRCGTDTYHLTLRLLLAKILSELFLQHAFVRVCLIILQCAAGQEMIVAKCGFSFPARLIGMIIRKPGTEAR